jgi:SAM-dependent methyltransferase
MTAGQLDQAKIDALGERVITEVNAAMSILNLCLGDRLGLYQTMVEAGPATVSELAQHTKLNERMLREWLECMAVGGYIEHDDGRFWLSPEQAAVFADRDHPGYATGFTYWAPSVAGAFEPLIEAFHKDGGVPYEAYGNDALVAIGAGNRPMFVNELATSWIPTMPDVEAKLKAGGRVADIGCGVGYSSIAFAQAYPEARVDGVDIDRESIAQAKRNAADAGVADRVSFHEAPAESARFDGPYDLVAAFECIHDMAYPVPALRKMRELAGSDGAVLIADEAAEDTLEDNKTFLGHFLYNFSVLHCLPQALVFPDAAGTGTVMRPSLLRDYAMQAGFSEFEVLPIENPFWRFYRLTP